VIVVWLGFLVLLAAVTATGTSISDGDLSIPGTDSADAQKVLERAFPGSDDQNDEDLQFVFQISSGTVYDAEPAAAITSAIASAAQVENVLSVSDPLEPGSNAVSADGTTALATITFANLNNDEELQKSAEQAIDAIADSVLTDQLEVIVGGALFDDGGPELLGPTEIAGAIIAFVVLMITSARCEPPALTCSRRCSA
jgi:RND superfamily putative drug exporter